MNERKLIISDDGIDETNLSKEEVLNKNPLFDRMRYFSLRNFTWILLDKLGISNLPIDMFEILKKMNISLLPYNSLKNAGLDKLSRKYNAYTILTESDTIIAFNPNLRIDKLRFSLAHELGHILLLHFNFDNFEYEKEANMFAQRFLMPAIVLKACDVLSPNEISQLCGVEFFRAKYRFSRYKLLLERKLFGKALIERTIAENFSNFVLWYHINK